MAALALRGVVVLSMPLDGDFADSIKGALSADVLIGGTDGQLAVDVPLARSAGAANPVLLLATAIATPRCAGCGSCATIDAPSGHYTVACDRRCSITRSTRSASSPSRSIARRSRRPRRSRSARSRSAARAALAFALVLALFWSRRLGAPIAELHRGAIAVSRGDLDHRIDDQRRATSSPTSPPRSTR